MQSVFICPAHLLISSTLITYSLQNAWFHLMKVVLHGAIHCRCAGQKTDIKFYVNTRHFLKSYNYIFTDVLVCFLIQVSNMITKFSSMCVSSVDMNQLSSATCFIIFSISWWIRCKPDFLSPKCHLEEPWEKNQIYS